MMRMTMIGNERIGIDRTGAAGPEERRREMEYGSIDMAMAASAEGIRTFGDGGMFLQDSGIQAIPGTRTLYLGGPVTDQMACAFNVMLLMLEQGAADEDVTVYISSPGGSVSAGLSMADTMALVSCDVATVCVGQAASIGAVLLMCGTKGKRTILPHSNVLIHQPSLSGGERPSMQTTDLSIVARAMESTRKAVYELMAEATGQSMERIERDCDRDHYLNAAEAVEYGIADAVARPHPRPDAGRRDDADED